MEAPREDLTRRVPFDVERAAEEDDGLTLTGYAAVFNEITRIDSFEGRFDEQIVKGAFRKTILERTPVLQFDHGSHPMVGSLPIGSIRGLREDKHGLHVEARLHDNWLVQPVRDAIRDGSIAGMSFRFNIVKDIWEEDGDVPLRTIKEVRLHELGPVVWPAYETTTVGVRSDVQRVLNDPDARAELARLLISDTADEAVREDTSDEAVNEETDEPAERHSEGMTQEARERVLFLIKECK